MNKDNLLTNTETIEAIRARCSQSITEIVENPREYVRVRHILQDRMDLLRAYDELRSALTAEAKRLDWLDQKRLAGERKGYVWDTWAYDTDKPIRDQIDARIDADAELQEKRRG